MIENILKGFGQILSHFLPTYSSSAKVVFAKPKTTPPHKLSRLDKIEMAIKQGPPEYKNLPVATMSAQMRKNIEKYPIFQKYPFLPIAQAILESSGFKKAKKPKQAFGWGVHAKGYKPKNVLEVLNDYMSAVGGRNATEEAKRFSGKTLKSRLKTSNIYKHFRDTGDLLQYANTYAPIKENPKTGGKYYARNLKNVMATYQRVLDKMK